MFNGQLRQTLGNCQTKIKQNICAHQIHPPQTSPPPLALAQPCQGALALLTIGFLTTVAVVKDVSQFEYERVAGSCR
jgi:hypothetical protein